MCIADVRSWFIANRLMINEAKTEFLIIGTRQQLEKTSIESIIISDTLIKPLESVPNLGSWQLLFTWEPGLCSCCTCFMELAAIKYKNK
ncbi:hypothetical protein pdam_00008219 [Pocillopora damicornis]|uniref:Reverse transcriptase domain-containing protein n=1 Tax=Pocillopora damicornis TaxID=46731 RepID=A0A3M6UUU4_POCDA|nr:hypothetical protein pdam_00008219 [Pocillopora damicornis]